MSENTSSRIVVISDHVSIPDLVAEMDKGLPVTFQLGDGRGSRTFTNKEDATKSVLNNYVYRLNVLGGFVKTAEGGAPRAAYTPATGETKPRSSGRKGKYQVQLDAESGTVVFHVENAVASYNFSAGALSADLSALKFYSNMLNQFANDPRAFIMGATELDKDGNPYGAGFVLDGYDSDKDDEQAATAEIIGKAKTAMNREWLGKHLLGLTLGDEKVERKLTGTKAEFVEKWAPAPAPAEVAPVEKTPSEVAPEPSEIAMVTENAGSLSAEEPKKAARKAAKVS